MSGLYGDFPSCATVIVCVFPAPVTVTVAIRCELDVLAVAAAVIDLSPVPEDGVNVNQVAPFLVMDQLVLDITEKVLSSADDEKLNDDKDTDISKLGNATCVIAISCVFPPPETVRVAIRGVVLGFAVAVNVIVLLPVPDELDTVNQVVPFLVIVQLVLDVMEKVCCPAPDVKCIEDVDTDKESTPAACVMLMVSCCTPKPVTEMVAVRCVNSVFVVAATVTVPFPEPDDGETASHDALPATFHDFVFVTIENDCSPPVFKQFIEWVDSDRVIGISLTVSRHPSFTNPSKSNTTITFDTLLNFQLTVMLLNVLKNGVKVRTIIYLSNLLYLNLQKVSFSEGKNFCSCLRIRISYVSLCTDNPIIIV